MRDKLSILTSSYNGIYGSTGEWSDTLRKVLHSFYTSNRDVDVWVQRDGGGQHHLLQVTDHQLYTKSYMDQIHITNQVSTSNSSQLHVTTHQLTPFINSTSGSVNATPAPVLIGQLCASINQIRTNIEPSPLQNQQQKPHHHMHDSECSADPMKTFNHHQKGQVYSSPKEIW